MARSTTTVRLFVAVYPTTDVAASLLERISGLDLPGHRPVLAEQVHLTLQFIGDVDMRQLDETVESVQRSTSGLGAFDLTMRELIVLPQRGRARLIAVATDEPPAMMEMQRRLAQRLARYPRSKPGDRFLPHMTLARFRSPAKFQLNEQHAALEYQPFGVPSIRLMRSTLRPDGAVHEVVQEFALT